MEEMDSTIVYMNREGPNPSLMSPPIFMVPKLLCVDRQTKYNRDRKEEFLIL